MQNTFSLFKNKGYHIYLTGTAARQFVLEGDWKQNSIVEFIVLASRQKVSRIKGLNLCEEQAPRGPLRIKLQLGNQESDGYLTCLNPGNDPQKTLEKALQRRGYSVEAIAVTPDGRILDPFNGIADLKQKNIKLLEKSPSKAFEQNAHKLISLSSLCAELNTKPSPKLQQEVSQEAGRILYTNRQGWFREMTMLLCHSHVKTGLQMLFDTRVLGFLLPEIHGMVGFAESSKYHHKDLWEHTLQVVHQAKPDPLIRWAALLHDVGKIWTRTYGSKGDVHFFQHDELGAILVEGIAARFQMPLSFQEDLAFLVRYHLRPNSYQSSWTDSAIRRLMKESGNRLEPLLQLSKADMTSGNPNKRRIAAKLSQELDERIKNIRAKDSVRSPLPKGIGTELMQHFQIEPGPKIGKVKHFLEGIVKKGMLLPDQPFEYYIKYLNEHPPSELSLQVKS